MANAYWPLLALALPVAALALVVLCRACYVAGQRKVARDIARLLGAKRGGKGTPLT